MSIAYSMGCESNSEDDILTAAKKEGYRADALIEAWAQRTGGTYESAAADLVKHRHILEEFNVKKSRLKTFSFDKFEGRLKFCLLYTSPSPRD